MKSFPYSRIVVIGVTGCGKSILAQKLAQKLGLEFIELDGLFWKPGWMESGIEEFRARVQEATSTTAWALAGNYGQVRDIVWRRAQALVWLDYSFPVVFERLFKRTFRRWWTKEILWETNYERLWPQFKLWSKESLFHWQVHTYHRHKKQYPVLISAPEYSHLNLIHFKNPKETEVWLGTL